MTAHLPLIIDSFAGGGGASTGIEEALGRWTPNTALVAPQVSRKQHRPDRIGGDTGPRIRQLGEVHPDHHRLPLDQLAAIYGTKEPVA